MGVATGCVAVLIRPLLSSRQLVSPQLAWLAMVPPGGGLLHGHAYVVSALPLDRAIHLHTNADLARMRVLQRQGGSLMAQLLASSSSTSGTRCSSHGYNGKHARVADWLFTGRRPARFAQQAHVLCAFLAVEGYVLLCLFLL